MSPGKEFDPFSNINKKEIFPSTAKKIFHLTSGSAIVYSMSSKLSCPLRCFLYNKSWLTEIPLGAFPWVTEEKVDCSCGTLGWVQFSLQSDLDSSSWNLMQSESLKCFRFIGKPCIWRHNCGKPSLLSFLGLFYLQMNYPIQSLHIHSTAMIGLIPRNHFEQPGNLIPLGKRLHIVTGFLNWVPNEW